MTINLANNNPRIAYSLAQGSTQQTFAIPFEFFNNSDVTVYIDGTLKSEGTHYSLTGGDGSTGNVVFNTTVTGATGGSTIVIFRLSDIERTSDFSAGADINRAALNEQLDILTAMIADQDDRIDRTIQVNDYEVAPSLILPTIANRKGKVLAFNATTGAVEAGPSVSAVDTVANTAADIQTVADNIVVIQQSPTNATNAAASASAASSSASAASSSASAASSSASSAAASFDSFDDRYLGAKTSDPTLDNDGNALLTGALYFDSVGAAMKVYTGSAWVTAFVSLSGALIASNNLSDLTNTTTARTNLGLGSIATQAASSVAITGGTIANGAITGGSINNTPIGATTASTIAGTTGTFSSNLTVDTNTLFVDATNNRVGINTSTPSTALEVVGQASFGDGTAAAPSITNTGNLNTGILFPAADTVAVATGGAERMRITSAGLVGIDNTAPDGNLTVGNTSTSGDVSIRIKGDATSRGFLMFGDAGGAQLGDIMYDHSDNHMRFRVNNTERMRIDSAGTVFFCGSSTLGVFDGDGVNVASSGETTINVTTGSPLDINQSTNDNIARSMIRFYRREILNGSITTSSTATAYVTASDYRLKENIQPMTGALGAVAQLNPVTYTWKTDGSDGQGFIAHELQEVVPDCVIGEKDAVDADGKPEYQGVDTSFLVATLTAAIQEQQALITALTARVSALENTAN